MRIAVCMRRAAWTFFATAALAAMAVWLAGDLLIHPVRHGAGVPPPDLPLRDVVFASDTGAPLHGWFIPGQPGQGAVLLLHGVRASRLSMVARSRFLHRAGYTVLLIDFQASGESPGDAITFGYREAFDVAASVRELRRLAPGESIGVIGTSMGGAATVLAGSSVQVDAVVLNVTRPCAIALSCTPASSDAGWPCPSWLHCGRTSAYPRDNCGLSITSELWPHPSC